MRAALTAVGVILALAVSACSKSGNEASATPSKSGAANAPGLSKTPARSQSEIAGVVAEMSSTQVAISQVLLDRNIKGPFADFAKQLQSFHQSVANNAKTLGAKRGEHGEVQSARTKAEAAALAKEKDNEALMNAYMAAVVRDHHSALSQFDGELIPAANADLRAYLIDTREQLAEQLEQAEALTSARH